jgi:hypothetical protein
MNDHVVPIRDVRHGSASGTTLPAPRTPVLPVPDLGVPDLPVPDLRVSDLRVSDGLPPTTVRTVEPVVRLRANAAAPTLARQRVRWICLSHDLPDDLVRAIAFIAGELVAISVRQVRAPLELHVAFGHDAVMIRVRDLGTGKSAHSRPNTVGTSRGLQLIRCIAQSSGISFIEDRREMWATVALRTPSP